MTAITNTSNNEKVELHGTMGEFREALEDEIKAIKKNGQSSTLLTCGVRMPSQGTKALYKFNVEYAPTFPADTPCKLVIGTERYDVTTVSFGEGYIILSAENSLPDGFSKARLENGSTVLMENLIKCIEANAQNENPAGHRMLPMDGNEVVPFKQISRVSLNDPKLNDAQNAAVSSALSNDITFIWGPPGTGKTSVIGRIIDELYKRDRSVLVVSHTNTAVDGAIIKADKAYRKQNTDNRTPYPILRLGTPVKELPDETKIESHMQVHGAALYKEKVDLEKQQTTIRKRIRTIEPIIQKSEWLSSSALPEIQNEIKALEVLDRKYNDLKRKEEDLCTSIEREKRLHPEYKQYNKWVVSLEKQINDLNLTSRRIVELEEQTSRLPEKIQEAKDNEKKHIIYEDLHKQESKMLSEDFLASEIEKSEKKQLEISTQMDKLRSMKKVYERSLAEYEQKGAVGRLIAGRGVKQQAEQKLDEIAKLLPELETILARQVRLAKDYKNQLDDLLSLKDQMENVVPSHTEKYWAAEYDKLSDKLQEARRELQLLSRQKDELECSVTNLYIKVDPIKAVCEKLQSLEGNIDQLHKAVKEYERENIRLREKCKEELRQEMRSCASFMWIAESDDPHDDHQKLHSLWETIKAELAGVDIQELKTEKDTLTEKLSENTKHLSEIKKMLLETERQSIMQARIIGATLTKTYLNGPLRERKFDTVILDEASMASVPALWCAAYLAERNIVLVGDFLQLPPHCNCRNRDRAEMAGDRYFPS